MINPLSTNSLLSDYKKEIKQSIHNDLYNNFDIARFGKNPDNIFQFIVRRMKYFLKKMLVFKKDFPESVLNKALNFIHPNEERFENLYKSLSDKESQDILIKILSYRALGFRKVKLATNTKEYWKGINDLKKISDQDNRLQSNYQNWDLTFFDLNTIGFPIQLYNTPSSVYNHFIEQQYQCMSNNHVIGVQEGDVVIDAGACWGEASLYFSYLSAPNGRVLSIEFLPSNLDIFKNNLELNTELAKRIEIIPKAVWSESNLDLDFQDNGPGTTLIASKVVKKGGKTETITIDKLVMDKDLPRVDFIKMDIEGAELFALKGAEKTIKKYHPGLAISIYHSLDDFLDIPEYIQSLKMGYKFFIRHFTIHAEETILFATAELND
jgi:FkbM family methyltransferase